MAAPGSVASNICAAIIEVRLKADYLAVNSRTLR